MLTHSVASALHFFPTAPNSFTARIPLGRRKQMQHHSIVPDACSLGRFFCVLTISLHSIRLWFIVNLTDRKNGNDNNWRARTCNCHPHIWWRRSKIAAKPSRAPTKCNETIERDVKSFYKKKFFRLSTNRISFHLFCCPQF